jgi:hypothetical protein
MQKKIITDNSFEKVTTFKHLGIIMAKQNDIHNETESRLNSGSASHHSIANI